MMPREATVQFTADAIKQAIKDTQAQVCCFGEFENPDHPDRNLIGYDGKFDLYALADALIDRLT